MAKITLILGGARSGKSAFAVEMARGYKRVAYIATAQALDDEMAERIRVHKASRPDDWLVIESPSGADGVIKGLNGKVDFVLFDCVTLYLTNYIYKTEGAQDVEPLLMQEIENLCKACRDTTAHVAIVSNEVGLGIVPDNEPTRRFRDLAGMANQVIAREAEEVYFLTAGIAQRIK